MLLKEMVTLQSYVENISYIYLFPSQFCPVTAFHKLYFFYLYPCKQYVCNLILFTDTNLLFYNKILDFYNYFIYNLFHMRVNPPMSSFTHDRCVLQHYNIYRC